MLLLNKEQSQMLYNFEIPSTRFDNVIKFANKIIDVTTSKMKEFEAEENLANLSFAREYKKCLENLVYAMEHYSDAEIMNTRVLKLRYEELNTLIGLLATGFDDNFTRQ